MVIERVMKKPVPVDREVKVTITITELCTFIEAARKDEVERRHQQQGQYEQFHNELNRASGKKSDIFGDLFGR